MKYVAIYLLFLISAYSPSSYAAACDDTTSMPEDFLFPKTFQSAQLLSRELCLIAGEADPDFATAAPLAELWSKSAIEESSPLKAADINLQVQINNLHEAILDGLPFKIFQLDKQTLTFNTDDSDLQEIPDNNKCKTTKFKLSCYEVLDQLRIALNTTNSATNAVEITAVAKTIGLYSKLWENYFEKARSQTFMELSINTYLYREELQKDKFVPPPDYQVIFLHPSIVLDYVSDADDGEQQGASLVIEWAGINWWDAKMPFGFSVITSYSDRSSVEDVGLGMMFHFDNNYSIGVADHDGDQSLLFTLDLLKLFEDKKTNLKNFKAAAQKYTTEN